MYPKLVAAITMTTIKVVHWRSYFFHCTKQDIRTCNRSL